MTVSIAFDTFSLHLCGTAMLAHLSGYQIRPNADITAFFSLLVTKNLEIPGVNNPDATALARHIKGRSNLLKVAQRRKDRRATARDDAV